MASPTIVIVPGACQTPAFYAPFAEALQTVSIPSVVVPNPSCGASPSHKDFSADVSLIRKTVTALLDDGEDVVVLMHSYGGFPGSAALKSLGKMERKEKGEKGGVIRLVYACSYAAREGEGRVGAEGIEYLREHASEGLDEEAGTLSMSHTVASYALWHDLPEKEHEHWSSLLEPHSLGALFSKQTYAAWRDIPSTYVICELDRVVPVEIQQQMIRTAKDDQPKAFDVVEKLKCGHEPLLSNIDELVSIVQQAAKGTGEW